MVLLATILLALLLHDLVAALSPPWRAAVTIALVVLLVIWLFEPGFLSFHRGHS